MAKKKQKNKSKYSRTNFIILGVILILSSILGVVFIQTNRKESYFNSQYTKLTQIDTSNWNTYKNESMGFFIKYPKSIVLHQETPGSVTFTLEAYKDDRGLLPVDLFVGIRGEIAGNAIEALKDESPIRNGEKIPKPYRLVQINNALGGQVLYDSQPVEDYYLTDANHLGYPLRVSIGHHDQTFDITVFQQMILTMEFIR